MAVIAIHTVVDVSTHALMLVVGPRLRMAVRALEDAVVVRIGMAGRTNPVCIAMIDVEPSVIESGSQPARGRMAGRTARWESRRYVIRIRRALVVHLVTAIAVGGDSGVVFVHVATCTRHGGVRTGQRERSVVMVEGGRSPCRRAVAHIALLWEPGGNMIRIRRSGKVGEVARHACRVRQAVVRRSVTLAALQGSMGSRQWPPGRGVVE